MIYPAGVDANSQVAAELLRALMRTAARFAEAGRSVAQDYFPHVRTEPIADLAGRAVRLGMELTLPGHELVFEVRVRVGDDVFTITGDLVLDDEESRLDLPPVETDDVGRFVALLDHYVDELTAPARGHVGSLIEAFGGS